MAGIDWDKHHQQHGYTYNPDHWSTDWDKNAQNDLSEIQTLESQMVTGGAALDPNLIQLRNQMYTAMHNRRWNIGDKGNAAVQAQQARTTFLTALQQAQRQGQMAQAQTQQAQATPPPQEFVAPGQEGAPPTVTSTLPGQAAVPTDNQDLMAWLTGNAGGPVTGEVNAAVNPPPRDPSWQTTPPPDTTIPTGTVDTSVTGTPGTTTGQGTVTGGGLPAYTAPDAAAVPEAQGPTEGYQRAIFDREVGGLLNTGDKELDDILRGMVTSQEAEGLEELLTAYISSNSGKDPDELTATQKKFLTATLEKSKAAAKEIHAMGVAQLSTAGMGKSSAVMDFSGATAVKLARDLATTELGYRAGVGTENRALRQKDMSTTLDFIKAVRADDTAKMSTILAARSSDLDRDLEAQQSQAKYDILRENQNLLRDNFTEDQRHRLKSEGWTDQQIAQAEQEMRWRQAFEEQKFVADHNLAVRNTDIAEKFQDKSLSIEEKDRMGRLALTEMKNKWDMTFQDRVQSLTEELGLRGVALDEEKMDYMWDRMQKEFGMDINRFALEKWATTGEFNLDVLNSQRSFDLSVAKEQNNWLISAAGLQVQETLGLTEIALRDVLSGRTISLEQDRLYTMKFLEMLGIDTQINEAALDRELQRWRDSTQYKNADKDRKMAFIGSIIGSAVKGAVGFAGGGGGETAGTTQTYQ